MKLLSRPSGALTIRRCANLCKSNVSGFTTGNSTSDVCYLADNCFKVYTAATMAYPYYGQATFVTRLDVLPNYAEFTTLYDMYRIRRVTLYMQSVATDASTSAPGVHAIPITGGSSCLIHSVLDSDDSLAPTASDDGIDALRQQKSYRCQNLIGRKPLKWTFTPRSSQEIQRASGSTGLAQISLKSWISSVYPDVLGFGLKFIVESWGTGSATTQVFKVWARYTLEFKDPK